MFVVSRFISYTLIGWVALQIANAASATLVAEQVEICHRSGGTVAQCGPLPRMGVAKPPIDTP